MRHETTPRSVVGGAPDAGQQNYKFQRLREQIRHSVQNGELHGRLPGERELACQYHANAKTINKAVGDLCSEGLLIRQVGRGTFVAHDHEGKESRSKSFLGLLLPGRTESPRRAKVLRLIEARLAAEGHRYSSVPARVDGQSGAIPLAAWEASLRHQTDGLLCYPLDPLSHPQGHLDDACVAQALRRHVPVVVLGVAGAGVRLNTVLPDYAGAGFSLTEHLRQVGCERVVAVRTGPSGLAAAAVLSGSQTAMLRAGGGVSEIVLPLTGNSQEREEIVARCLSELARERERRSPRSITGILCIGSMALRAVSGDRRIGEFRAARQIVLACALELGESAALAGQITTYEIDVEQAAAWAARLLMEFKPGQRPIEVIVPGRVHIGGLPGAGLPPVPGAWSGSQAELPAAARNDPVVLRH